MLACAAEFIRLGALDSPQKRLAALSISDDGTVVSGDTTEPTEPFYSLPFRWTRETGVVLLDTDLSIAGQPLMSANGSLITWETRAAPVSGERTRIWTEDSGTIYFDLKFIHGYPISGDESISDDGSVIVGHADDSSLAPAGLRGNILRWTRAGGFQTLGNPPGATPGYTWSQLVSPDGSVVVGTGRVLESPLDRPLFRWTAHEGLTSLGQVPSHNYYVITGISTNGKIVTGISGSLAPGMTTEKVIGSLWRWTEETGLVVLEEGTPEKRFQEQRYGVGQLLSADGSVLVGDRRSADGGQSEAYRWTTETGFQQLPTLSGRPYAAVRDITPDGIWVFGQSWTNPGDNLLSPTLDRLVPWLWSEETGTLNLLEIFKNQGLGPSIEGWESLWDGGANFGRISANGRAIIGTGRNPEGFLEGWVAYLDPITSPEPTGAALALLALPCTGSRWRRHFRD
jgi:uncharacterized membrane protein